VSFELLPKDSFLNVLHFEYLKKGIGVQRISEIKKETK
jgi:hypothetical protein